LLLFALFNQKKKKSFHSLILSPLFLLLLCLLIELIRDDLSDVLLQNLLLLSADLLSVDEPDLEEILDNLVLLIRSDFMINNV